MSSDRAREICRQWVVLGTGLDDDNVLLSHQLDAPDAERPTLPYATVEWAGDVGLSATPYKRVGDESDPGEIYSHDLVVNQRRRGTLRVVFYGDEGIDLANQLELSKQKQPNRLHLQQGGCSVWTISDVLDTRELRDTKHEASALQDYAVMYAVEYTWATGIIETVEAPLTAQYEGE